MGARRGFSTGGAWGWGRALAERYARAGCRVASGDVDAERGAEALSALHQLGAEAVFLRCDVRHESDLEAAATELEVSWGGVDLVINNAGVAAAGDIAALPLADWLWIVDINLLGVVRGCRAFVPRLRRQGGGQLVNVASMAGLVHPPLMSAYCATKAGVVALSESLRLELAADRIVVSVVCPAFFRTRLTETMRAADAGLEGLTGELVTKARRSADGVAERVFRGVERGDFWILTHPEGRLAWMGKRLLPFRLYSWSVRLAARRMMRRPGATRR